MATPHHVAADVVVDRALTARPLRNRNVPHRAKRRVYGDLGASRTDSLRSERHDVRFADAVTTAVEYRGFWGSFWDIIWWFLAVFIFFAYLMVLFSIIGDVFRDRKLGGGWKAVWIICLIFFPFITALIYLIARGGGMAERSAEAAQQMRSAQDDYIKSVAGSASPAEDIAKAKSLLDSGAITQTEFEKLKAKALN